MSDNDFLLGQIVAGLDRVERAVTSHSDDIAEIKRVLAENAGERRAAKWFYSAGGAAMTGLAAAALKVAGVLHIVAGSGATK